uniref:PiggyBac transposable element-derived protein domain-containing protein n=1 Tax=Octopus bimaculoides TaxID=37653 RepID=A0A0L8FYN6_OCTBM
MRPDARAVDNLGVTGNLVVQMTEGYQAQNYSLFTDRFYTSVEDHLVDVGLHEVERAEHQTTNNHCAVFMEKHRQVKRANSNAQYKDLPKQSKTIFWCNHYKIFLCIRKPGSNLEWCIQFLRVVRVQRVK